MTILGLMAIGIFAQSVLPISKATTLVFVEPFENLGPDKGQEWLSKGFPGFIRSSLSETEQLETYLIPDFQVELVDRPHRLQDMIWKSVFQKRVDPQYKTYLILGNYSFLEGQITVRMDLLSLGNTHVLAHFEKTLSYTKLLTWKEGMGEWVLSQLQIVEKSAGKQSLTPLPDGITPVPGVSISKQLTTLFDKREQNESDDLKRRYERQSRLKLGSQLEGLWHTIAYDPYLAKIYDIQTSRLQYEPDSVLVSFKVSYRINPRILDEIEHFSKTRSGLVVKTESFEEHAFMDLGYIDADFTSELAGGDWRMVPVISMGPDSYPKQRVFYHSYPRPITPPGENYYNQGNFKQLLLAVPGVDALRIFAQENNQTYEYSIVVGYDEMKKLDKIKVRFVAEQDLLNQLK